MQRPTSFTQMEGCASTAGVFLHQWEMLKTPDEKLRQNTYAMMKVLFKYTRSFPMGLPVAWRCQGLLDWLEDRPDRAHESWKKALQYAREMHIPYEEAETCYEIGRHLEKGNPQKIEYLTRAREIFERLNAGFELEQTNREIGL